MRQNPEPFHILTNYFQVMSKETMVYIFSFDSKSGVFTLTSSKDQLTINSKHKKYEWLRGQEAGRIIKISDKGRWTSSNDYDNLYQIIKPIKKAEKKLTSSKNTNEKPGVYCFSFIENEFVLTDQNGDEIKITSKHKKFEWLQSQDSGRVIKISEKGRWNSSKDYDGLYDKIKSSKKKASQSVSKPTTQKPKSDNSDETKKLKEEIKNLQLTIQNQRDELKRLGSNYNELKKEKEDLIGNLITTQKAKTAAETDRDRFENLWKKEIAKKTIQYSKPKVIKPKIVKEPKKYVAKITATYSYRDILEKKYTKSLDIKIVTGKMDKKPSQSFFKSYLKLATSKSWYTTIDKCGMNIYLVYGIPSSSTMQKKKKISDINFISIDEY